MFEFELQHCRRDYNYLHQGEEGGFWLMNRVLQLTADYFRGWKSARFNYISGLRARCLCDMTWMANMTWIAIFPRNYSNLTTRAICLLFCAFCALSVHAFHCSQYSLEIPLFSFVELQKSIPSCQHKRTCSSKPRDPFSVQIKWF